jgi:hypothetical protein
VAVESPGAERGVRLDMERRRLRFRS